MGVYFEGNFIFNVWKEKCDILKMVKSENKVGEELKMESWVWESRVVKEEG